MDLQSSFHVIRIGDLFFNGFGKRGQVLTAWSLMGALKFGPPSPHLENVCARLREKGKEIEVLLISIDPLAVRLAELEKENFLLRLKCCSLEDEVKIVKVRLADKVLELPF